MNSFVSSIKDLNKQNALNTCLLSLNEMIDFHTFDETKQNYTELFYNGSVKNISDIKVRYPSKRGTNIPICGYIAGTIPVIVGYTDGEDVSVSNTFLSQLQTTSTELKTESVKVSSMGKDSITKEEREIRYSNGLVVNETTYITVTYTEEKDIKSYNTTVTDIIEHFYNKKEDDRFIVNKDTKVESNDKEIEYFNKDGEDYVADNGDVFEPEEKYDFKVTKYSYYKNTTWQIIRKSDYNNSSITISMRF